MVDILKRRRKVERWRSAFLDRVESDREASAARVACEMNCLER